MGKNDTAVKSKRREKPGEYLCDIILAKQEQNPCGGGIDDYWLIFLVLRDTQVGTEISVDTSLHYILKFCGSVQPKAGNTDIAITAQEYHNFRNISSKFVICR